MKLKSCPFCGGEAVLQGESDCCYVRCLKCDSKGSSVSFEEQEDEDYSVFENSAEQSWNNRKDRENLIQEIIKMLEESANLQQCEGRDEAGADTIRECISAIEDITI